jgi:hypothetical protein
MELMSDEKLEFLLQAFATGDVYLVDEDGRHLQMQECLDSRCWAHLRNVEDKEFYVQEMPGARELLKPRWLAVLGLNV